MSFANMHRAEIAIAAEFDAESAALVRVGARFAHAEHTDEVVTHIACQHGSRHDSSVPLTHAAALPINWLRPNAQRTAVGDTNCKRVRCASSAHRGRSVLG